MENRPKIWTKDFIGITIINLLIFMGFQMLLPTLPLYVKSLGGADSAIGWITGLTTISALIIRPVSGVAVDKWGRKVILLAGIGLIIAVTLSYWLFPYVGVILAIRFLHGFGWGASSTSSNTVATDVISKERFGESMGFFSLSSGLAMALAPGLGLALLAGGDASNLMFTSTGFGVVAFCLALFFRYRTIERQQIATKKAAIFEPASILPAIVMFFVSTAYGSIVSFLSIYALEKGIANIGMYFFVYAAAMLVTRPIFGRLVDRLKFSAAMYPGLILLIIAMVILSQASTMLSFLFVALLFGVGFGAVQSSLQTLAVIYASKDRLGAANATFFTGFDGGIGFGSIIAGVVSSALGYNWMYLTFAIFPALAGILYFFTSGKINKTA
jgi:MFS family permease